MFMLENVYDRSTLWGLWEIIFNFPTISYDEQAIEKGKQQSTLFMLLQTGEGDSGEQSNAPQLCVLLTTHHSCYIPK